MLAFEFDRTGMRRQLKPYALAAFAEFLFLILVLVGYLWQLLGVHTHWVVHTHWAEGLLAGCLFAVMKVWNVHLYRFDLLRSCLKRQQSALIVNSDGIIVNALNQPSGQIAWQDIEKMYPTELIERLFGSTWQKMPVVSKQRGLAVILKQGTDFQRHYRDSGRWKIIWLFIPETLLTKTADDVMVRLNKFYITQVREQGTDLNG